MMGLLGAMAGLGKGLSMVAEDNIKTIQRQEETAAAEDRQMKIAAWKAKMDEEYAIARENRAVARDEEKTKRLIDDTLKADVRSQEMGTDRRFAKFKQDGLAAGYFEGMSDDEIKQVFKDHYDDRQVTNEAGGDRYQDKTREIKSQDRLKAAQETGNSGLIATSLKGVDDARAADALDVKERLAKAEADRKERESEKRWEIEQAKIDARYFGDKKDSTTKDFLGYIRESRMAINNEKDRLTSMMKAEVDAEMNPEEKAKIVRSYKERMAKLDTKAEALDADMKNLKERSFGGGSNGYSDEAAKSGTPTGGNAAPRTSGRGDPATGSGIVGSDEQSTGAKLKELNAQFAALLAEHEKNPSSKTADVLQALERQIRELEKQPAQKVANQGRGTVSPGDINTKEQVGEFQVKAVRRVDDKKPSPAMKERLQKGDVKYDPAKILDWMSKGHGPEITYRHEGPSIYGRS